MVTADTDTNVSAASSDKDCHAASPSDNSPSAAVNAEIQQFSYVETPNVCDNDVTCPTELDSAVTPSDTNVTDQISHAADSTVQHVTVAASTSDSESNLIQQVESESSNTEHNHKTVRDSEAKKTDVDSPQDEAAAIDSTPPAESADDKESNQNVDKDQPSKPNTMLSWSDPTCDVTTSKTNCAIQFQNSVIFDLDVE